MLYVGQTINPDLRFKQHIIDSSKKEHSSIFLYNAFNKHGIENFQYTIIEKNVPLKNVSEREKYWIKYLNTKRPFGYNLTDGGEGTFGYIHTEESKRKMSDKKRGKLTHFQSTETRQKISNANTGRKISRDIVDRLRHQKIGKPVSPEHREKIKNSLKGKPKSPQHSYKLKEYWNSLDSNQFKNRINPMIEARSKEVNMIDMNTKNILITFNSMRKAAAWIRENTNHIKASHTRISFVCGDTNKSAYDYHWDYK